MFSSSLHATMLIGRDSASVPEDESSPLSSPVDDSSYKIRIGPRGSSSPASQEGEEGKEEMEDEGEAQDLTVSAPLLLHEPMDEDKSKINMYEDENSLQ